MYLDELFLEEEIESKIKFNKEMVTVYDLAYLLIDFQAVINNMVDMIYNSIENRYQKVASKLIYDNTIMEESILKNEIAGQSHPSWQKEIEDNFDAIFLDKPKIVADYRKRTTLGYKQTTSRRFNKKYRMNLKLNGFSEGSLILNLANSLIVSILTDFLKELVVNRTGKQNVININIYNTQYIEIDNNIISSIPKDSCVRTAIRVKQGDNRSFLDVQKCIHDVVGAAKPDYNIEESVRRLLKELERTGLVERQIIYDERGIKTAGKDIERFSGHFIDVKI